MKKEKRKLFKLLAILFSFSLLAIIPSQSVQAEESSAVESSTKLGFTVYNLNKDKFVEQATTMLYCVTEEDIAISEKIKEGDTLKDCYIILDKTDVASDNPLVINSTTGNYIKTTSQTDSISYGNALIEELEYGGTTAQLIYIDGNFGKVSYIAHDVYMYGGNIRVEEDVQVGDTLLNNTFKVKITDTSSYNFLFKVHNDNLEFVTLKDEVQCSINGNPPSTINFATLSSCLTGHYYYITFTEGTIGDYTINEDCLISSADYSVYKVKEVKANEIVSETPEEESAPTESSPSESVNINSPTINDPITNVDSTKQKESSYDWAWYCLGGIILVACAVFVIRS